MGKGAIKARKQATKAKKQVGQSPPVPPLSPPPPPPLPPSPPGSPHEVAIHAEMDVDTHAAAKAHKRPATKERKGPHVAPSDQVTRFRGVLGDTSSRSTGGVSEAKAASKLFQPHEIV